MKPSSDYARRPLDRATVARRRADQLASLLSRAQNAADSGDVDEALAACEEVLVLDPDNDTAARLVERVRTSHLVLESTESTESAPVPHHRDGVADPRSLGMPEVAGAMDLFPSETDLAAQRSPELAFRTEAEIGASQHEEVSGTQTMMASSGRPPLPRIDTRAHGNLPSSSPAEHSTPLPPSPVLAPTAPVLRVAEALPLRARLARSLRALVAGSEWTPVVGTAVLLLLAVGVVGLWAALGLPPSSARASVPRPTATAVPEVSTNRLPDRLVSSTDAGRTTTEAPRIQPERDSATKPSVSTPPGSAARPDARPAAPPRVVATPTPNGPAAVAVATTGTRETTVVTPAQAPPQAEALSGSARVPERPIDPVPAAAPPATVVEITEIGVPPPAPVPVAAPPPATVLAAPANERLEARNADARDGGALRAAAIPSAPTVEPSVAPTRPAAVPVGAPGAAGGGGVAVVDDERAIRQAVTAYTAAYSGLDVDAVKAVFPSVNDAALRRAFRSLRSQRVELRGAAVAIAGSAASVSGTWVSSAVGQVGASTPQRDERPVIFTLEKRDGSWVIVARR